ncbi:MAG TPA: PAS domain-containing protein, partial [Thermoanaerobaculia bacterium]|nr:PAS domain-containing protein [Thermoanaerobaculia bacterium]
MTGPPEHPERRRGDHQTAEALRATEARLQLALAGARAGVWQWNLLTDEVIWSPEIYDLLGLERGAVEPSNGRFLEVIHPDDREATLALVAESVARGGHFGMEFRALRADGTEMWVSSFGRIEHDAEGRPVMAVGINQDITARRQAEQQREEALRTMQLALEIAQAGVWNWDLVVDRVTGDESLARVFHLPVAEVVAGHLTSKEFFRTIHPEDLPRVEERLQEVFAVPGEYELEFRLLHADGATRWMVSRGRVELGADGEVRRLTGLILDITDRKQAELHARFLLELDTALASLSDAEEIEQTAVDRLGSHLDVEHCYFAQIAGKRVAILREYRSV